MKRTTWGQNFDWCFMCGNRDRWGFRRETHEIIGAAYRQQTVKLPAFWVRLCMVPCHRSASSMPNRNEALYMLWMKLKHDPEHFDLKQFNVFWMKRGRTEITWDELHEAADRFYGAQCHLHPREMWGTHIDDDSGT